MKEAELRLADIRKAKIEFERRLLKPIKEPEKVLQYIKDKSKVKKSRWHQPVPRGIRIDFET